MSENNILRPIVGQEMPLKDAVRSHYAQEESGSYGKIVLIPAYIG
jgi:NADPH:quinone reductase-like Zn-dependent oxidoreductase